MACWLHKLRSATLLVGVNSWYVGLEVDTIKPLTIERNMAAVPFEIYREGGICVFSFFGKVCIILSNIYLTFLGDLLL